MPERGELWRADLGEPHGSAPAKPRPVLVVSADAFNRSRLQTVICVVVTSTLRLADAPGNVLMKRTGTGLTRNSVANVSQVVTLDKDELLTCIGHADRATMRRVDAGLRLALELDT